MLLHLLCLHVELLALPLPLAASDVVVFRSMWRRRGRQMSPSHPAPSHPECLPLQLGLWSYEVSFASTGCHPDLRRTRQVRLFEAC